MTERLMPPLGTLTPEGDIHRLSRMFEGVTDKVGNGYLPAYYHLAMRARLRIIVELGVLGGGSLALWQTLWPEALVVGIDHDPLSTWPEGTVRVVADTAEETLADLLTAAMRVPTGWDPALLRPDLIIDDASHDTPDVIAALRHLWPTLAPGGWYVIEDWFVGLPSQMGRVLDLAGRVEKVRADYGEMLWLQKRTRG